MGDQRGQTSAELLGGLVLVAAIVGALVTAGVPGALAGNVERLVCEIGGGDCAAAADPPAADGGRPTAPDVDAIRGPAPIPSGSLVVLPFPGSVSVTCTVARDREKACKAAPGSGVAVQSSGEVKVERTPTKLNGKGCPQQVLSVTTTLKLEGSGTVGGKGAKGKLSAYLGQSSRYAVTVAPDQADAIARGERPPPNAVDPRTILPGESVQLNEDFYTGHNLTAEYRALQVQLGYDKGQRVSSGVTRVNDSTVRVYVGDEDFVRDALTVGLGAKGAKIALGSSRELSDGKLRGIDIDISSPAGWNAYQQFVTTGRLPKSGMPGTSYATSSTTTKYSGSTGFEAELGPIKTGGILNDEETYISETTHPDGTIEWSGTGRVNDAGVEIRTRRNADGTREGQPTYALNLEGVDKGEWESLQYFTGSEAPLPPGGNVRMEFTASDFEALRQQAIDALVPWLKHEHDLADDEIDDIRVARDGTVTIGESQPIKIPAGMELAGIFANADRTPEELLLLWWRWGWGRPNGPDDLIHELTAFAQQVARGRGDWTGFPGRVRIPDCEG